MEKIIKEKVASLMDINKEDVTVIERLMGGMSNIMYVIEVNNKKYTFRIPGKNANNFVDRTIESKNIEIVKDFNINNETVKFDVEDGYKIAEFVEGNCLVDTSYLEHLDEVTNVLKKLHNSDKKAVNDYDWLGRLKKYEQLLVDENYTDDRSDYLNLKYDLINNFGYFDNAKLVLCHGDSQLSNFVVAENKLYLLDWEFCGNNDPYYDIACFGNKNFDDALKLLDAYLGRKATADEIKKLNYFRAFQCLQWHNVALYKHLIGLSEELNVPFFNVSNMYLEKAKDFLNNAR